MQLDRRSFLAGSLAFGLGGLRSDPSEAASVARILRGEILEWRGNEIDLSAIKKFYQRRFGSSVWTHDRGLSKKGKELIAVLKEADKEGLEPKDYLTGLPEDVEELTGLELANAELFLSQAYWRFARDLYAGKSASNVSEPDIIIPRKKAEPEKWLRVASRQGPKKAAAQLRPSHPQYAALRKLLPKSRGRLRKQIIINMERWRWLPRSLGDRHVLVNQAGFELMVNEGNKTVDQRRVVVGKPYHRTPMFSHEIQYAEFNPTWTVPRSIIDAEMLPRIRRDPGYLTRNNYKVYSNWELDAPALDPKEIDWKSVNRDNFPYRIEQQPGKRNALGKVKFLFPNRFDVYLHDTPAKNLFKRRERALSYGCIRVHKPLEFAEVLFGNQGLDKPKIDKILENPETHRVDLRKPTPIHLAYFTVWADKGKPKVFRDIYGVDKLVGKILFS